MTSNRFMAFWRSPSRKYMDIGMHLYWAVVTVISLTMLAATINAAKYFGRETVQGTVAANKRADLVLLDADPLLDIRNTRRIAAVVVRGRLISKTDIDRILAARRR